MASFMTALYYGELVNSRTLAVAAKAFEILGGAHTFMRFVLHRKRSNTLFSEGHKTGLASCSLELLEMMEKATLEAALEDSELCFVSLWRRDTEDPAKHKKDCNDLEDSHPSQPSLRYVLAACYEYKCSPALNQAFDEAFTEGGIVDRFLAYYGIHLFSTSVYEAPEEICTFSDYYFPLGRRFTAKEGTDFDLNTSYEEGDRDMRSWTLELGRGSTLPTFPKLNRLLESYKLSTKQAETSLLFPPTIIEDRASPSPTLQTPDLVDIEKDKLNIKPVVDCRWRLCLEGEMRR